MRIFSTFTGIGGFEVGIQNAITKLLEAKGDFAAIQDQPDNTGDVQQARGLSATFIGYSEIDKYATSVYEKHFKGVKNYGDITKINEKELPDFDCLVGGFPCQAFSIAGKRRGFQDTRGTLFFDLARILREKQPRLFVFENVKGLLSHDQGRTFTTIIATLDELGYDCQWQVLNSKDFGVPQNRERVIIVGHLRGTPRPEVFPIGENSQQDIVLPTLTTRYAPAQANGGYIGEKQKKVARAVITPDRLEKRQNGRRMKEDGEPSLTVNTQDRHGVYDGMKLRRLTPLECERLQAFPDNWTKYDAMGVVVSDTQRYKMCGNAVTTNVIQAVFERILS